MPHDLPLAEPAGHLTGLPPTPSEPACAPPADRRHAWQTGNLSWDVFYLVVFAAVLVIVLISTPGSKVVAVAAMAALIPWFLLVGRPLWTRGQPGRLHAAIYVIGLFVLFGTAQSQNPEVWFLAFAISPQFFMFLNERLAMWLGVALNFLAAGLLVLRYPSGATAAVAFGVAVAGGGFSIFYSGWVSRIIKQSEERAGIIDQLEATRVELAAAQHEAGRLAERQRLSADIHDTLAQGFTSILMLIQAAQADLDGSHPRAVRHLDLAAAAARENLAEARALVADLAPAQLDGSTLPDALRRLSQAPGTQASFAVSGRPRAAADGRRGRAAAGVPGGAGQRAQARECAFRHRPARLQPGRGPSGGQRRRSRIRPGPGERRVWPARDADPGRRSGRHADGVQQTRHRHPGQRGGAGMTVIRVVLADDHPVVREGLRGMLTAEPDIEVVGEAASGPEAVVLAERLRPDVVLMDLRMPGGDGVEATRRLAGTTVVVLTTYDSDADILRAVEAGAAGYLLKDTPRAVLADRVRAAARGETVLAPTVAGRLLGRIRGEPGSRAERLSARETQVLALVARGLTNAEIGRELYLSEATVKTHLLRASAKLGVSGRTAAVTRAIETGALPAPGR